MINWQQPKDQMPPLGVALLVCTSDGYDIATFDGNYWEGHNTTYPVDDTVKAYAEITEPYLNCLPPSLFYAHREGGIVDKATGVLVQCEILADEPERFKLTGTNLCATFAVKQGRTGCKGCEFDHHILCSAVTASCHRNRIFVKEP